MTPSFAFIAYADFVDDLRTLAAAVAAGGWVPSHIVGIGRGGLVPAVHLSHATGWPMLSCDWSGGDRETIDPTIARLAKRTRQGERLLLIDDINDTGKTIAALRSTLAAAGARMGAIRIAVLIDNAVSPERVDYRARTIDRRVTKDWFVFPWEAQASRGALTADAAAVPGRIG